MAGILPNWPDSPQWDMLDVERKTNQKLMFQQMCLNCPATPAQALRQKARMLELNAFLHAETYVDYIQECSNLLGELEKNQSELPEEILEKFNPQRINSLMIVSEIVDQLVQDAQDISVLKTANQVAQELLNFVKAEDTYSQPNQGMHPSRHSAHRKMAPAPSTSSANRYPMGPLRRHPVFENTAASRKSNILLPVFSNTRREHPGSASRNMNRKNGQPGTHNKNAQGGDSEEYEGCNCSKSECLKMYCKCFSISKHCVDTCRCISCKNTPSYEEERQAAIHKAIMRQPDCFVPKTHKLALCACKKTKCLKLYCECFSAKKFCTGDCRCNECANYKGSQLFLQVNPQMAEPQVEDSGRRGGSKNRKTAPASANPSGSKRGPRDCKGTQSKKPRRKKETKQKQHPPISFGTMNQLVQAATLDESYKTST